MTIFSMPSEVNMEVERILHSFTLKEIRKALKGMEKNKALGPDGFIVEFFIKFWRSSKIISAASSMNSLRMVD